ncbi:MAG TPA: DUF2795 domain-containing protein [Gaiellaceae bacterium]|nr:DUF2795 domain-containing protein [Gaiellaceae bacterium]
MEFATVAELQVLLEGVPLPNERSTLVKYATREGATWELLQLLRALPDRRFETIDEVAEELLRVQPAREREVPHRPREESGAPPGGDSYTQLHPGSGQVRDLGAVTSD